jgi:hypothetical protein
MKQMSLPVDEKLISSDFSRDCRQFFWSLPWTWERHAIGAK